MPRLSSRQFELVLSLSNQAFAAALDPTEWNTFVEAFRSGVGLTNAAFGTYGSDGAVMTYTANYPAESLITYAEYYRYCDPWLAVESVTATLPAGTILTTEQVLPDEALRRTEFYNEWSVPYGITGGGAAVIDVAEGGLRSCLGFSKPPNRLLPDCTIPVLTSLLPQLRLALRASRSLAGERTAKAAAWALLDRATSSVFLCDREGRIVGLNRRADELLRQQKALASKGGFLAGTGADVTNRLRASIAAANDPLAPRASSLAVPRPDRGPLTVLALPIRRDDVQQRVAAVLVTDPEDLPPDVKPVLRQLYGLTEAEARLSVLLASGLDVAELAHTLTLSPTTVRAHLRSIFSKTETRRQAELVKLVCTAAGGFHNS